jgi:hypothetical protein
MGSKSQFFERVFLSRVFMRTTATATAGGSSTTIVLTAGGSNFSAGDIIQIANDTTPANSLHAVTTVVSNTLTFTPATGSGAAVTSGAVNVVGYAAQAIWIALFTANPTETTDTATEVSGGSYVRIQVTQANSNWTQNSTGTDPQQIQNTNAITFSPGPSANWGVVTGVGVYDASSGGNLLYWGALSANKTVNNGDPAPSFPANALTITET